MEVTVCCSMPLFSTRVKAGFGARVSIGALGSEVLSPSSLLAPKVGVLSKANGPLPLGFLA